MRHTVLFTITLAACTSTEPEISLRPCDPSVSSSGDESTSTTPSESSSEESSSEESSSTTDPAFECPEIVNGDVEFCAPGFDCRDVYVIGADTSNATSSMILYWHGTYEGANNPLSNALPWGMAGQADAANALVVMPRAHADALGRTGPFPWFTVCPGLNPTHCDRQDDFALAEMVVACSIEQELAAADRITTAGLSAGGIMASRLVTTGVGEHELAGVVSWSGGAPPAHAMTVPASEDTSVFVLHGGASDLYCGVGNLPGSCGGYAPYAFAAPSELLGDQVAAAGNFAFVCDHGDGHGSSMGPQGTEFLLSADLDGHPWVGFPFGVSGNGGWPGMVYSSWMLRNYNNGGCHLP